jgi:hypothetical protein
MRRTLTIFSTGILMGVLLTLLYVELQGGWYEYFTLPADRCQVAQTHAEVVPNQPNPCHFRYRRWSLIN